jgi:DNA helicase HerA-like ATPase
MATNPELSLDEMQELLEGSEELRALEPRRTVGRIVSVTGSQAIIQISSLADAPTDENRAEMGSILKVVTPTTVAIGIVSGLSSPMPSQELTDPEIRIAEVELVGELVQGKDGEAGQGAFKRGVSVFPALGDKVLKASSEELENIYGSSHEHRVRIGTLHQDPSLPAYVITDQLLAKHFAVLGTTGSGKSCAVALILRGILKQHNNAHIVLLDPHNEYFRTFGRRAEVINPDTLELPYWLLNQEEIIEVLVGNEATRESEIDILNELIPEAKRIYQMGGARTASLSLRKVRSPSQISIDTPTPYRISDVISLLDQTMGRLDRPRDLLPYRRLKNRIETLTMDRRYGFMFGNFQVLDRMAEIIGRIFRIPVDGRPLTILDLSGVPSEILNVVVSVIARMTFDLAVWSNHAIPVTLVCEEAHRYVPNDPNLGFEPTKRALSRIAKEGRKYGVSLGLISQRPSEISATILSQCNTVFALRMTNQNDQNFVSAALADSAGSLFEFLPSLGDSEAIAIGEGVAMPMRLCFDRLPESAVPYGKGGQFSDAWNKDIENPEFLEDVVASWRNQKRAPDEE